MYDIYLTGRAGKDLEKIRQEDISLIKQKLSEYRINPFIHAKKLSNPLLGNYRFKIGNYRVIFDIDGNRIVILRIGHRKEIYRK